MTFFSLSNSCFLSLGEERDNSIYLGESKLVKGVK